MDLDDINIRRLLNIEFIYDSKINKHKYPGKFFYCNDHQIVCAYYINVNEHQQYIIPVIGMSDILIKNELATQIKDIYISFYQKMYTKRCLYFIKILEKKIGRDGSFIFNDLLRYLI